MLYYRSKVGFISRARASLSPLRYIIVDMGYIYINSCFLSLAEVRQLSSFIIMIM